MQFYPKVEKFVLNAFTHAHNPGDIKHFERTVYWLKELKPDADEALCIAAFAHDIERAFRKTSTHPVAAKSAKGFQDEEFMDYHQIKGAEIIINFLQEQNAPHDLMERVGILISKHEVGGDEDQNILKDADSVSYFENQVQFFIKNKTGEVGTEKVKDKFQWMFDRISSEKAKNIARPWYEQAIKQLESYGGK